MKRNPVLNNNDDVDNVKIDNVIEVENKNRDECEKDVNFDNKNYRVVCKKYLYENMPKVSDKVYRENKWDDGVELNANFLFDNEKYMCNENILDNGSDPIDDEKDKNKLKLK